MSTPGEGASGILLDTHSWIWLRAGKLQARPETIKAIKTAAEEGSWFISDITLSEIAQATSRKRLRFDQPLLDWFQSALRPPGPRVLHITPEVAAATLDLPDTFHGDPGDRILAATAIIYNLTICTHDDLLLKFAKQGLFRAVKVNEIKEPHAK